MKSKDRFLNFVHWFAHHLVKVAVELLLHELEVFNTICQSMFCLFHNCLVLV